MVLLNLNMQEVTCENCGETFVTNRFDYLRCPRCKSDTPLDIPCNVIVAIRTVVRGLKKILAEQKRRKQALPNAPPCSSLDEHFEIAAEMGQKARSLLDQVGITPLTLRQVLALNARRERRMSHFGLTLSPSERMLNQLTWSTLDDLEGCGE